MTLEKSLKNKNVWTRRFVTTSVVSENVLPYACEHLNANTPENLHNFWNCVIDSQPDHEPDKENCVVVIVNARLRPIAWNRVSIGTVDQAMVHPREVLRPVIVAAGYGFMLLHNHPAGDPTPSRADQEITRRLVEASVLLQIRFLDHVIIGRPAVGRNPYYSFREAGLMS